MLANDEKYYVVKFQNNPQHMRVLSNEFLATRLAETIGLPVAHAEVIQVDPILIGRTPNLNIQLRGKTVLCTAGVHFGSQYVIDPHKSQIFDYLPEEVLGRVRNRAAFAGMLVLDKWTCNADGRQAVFSKKAGENRYKASFIDQGFCFNAGEWTFPDSPLRGVYDRNRVYEGIKGWESFEPWLSQVEGMGLEQIVEHAKCVVPEWYGCDWLAMEKLVKCLFKRRLHVRELILQFRDSSRNPFPDWTCKKSLNVGPRALEMPPGSY